VIDVHPVYGENHVHTLIGVDSKLSIQSIISILSTHVAPQLHQKPTQINWFGDLIWLLELMPRQHNFVAL